MSIVQGLALDNWYRDEGAPSINLLRGYIRTMERNARLTVEDYRQNRQKFVTEQGEEEVHEGCACDTWELDHLLEEYFPNLQRWGMLTTIYAFLEYELEALCNLFIKDLALTVTISDMKGQGVERAMAYLCEVVGLRFDNRNDVWREIKTIKKIRNMIVRSNGKYPAVEQQREREVVRYISKSEYLFYAEEVVMREGFLDHVLTLFASLFQRIAQLIKTRNST
jgi:hypothetical protein